MDMLQQLKDWGYDPDNLDKPLLEHYLRLYPEWAEVYKRIAAYMPIDQFTKIHEDMTRSNFADFRDNLDAVKRSHIAIARTFNTDIFNQPSVLAAFINKYNQNPEAIFSFIVGKEIMTRNGTNLLLDNFIRPRLKDRVYLFRYKGDQTSPEFQAQVVDEELVTFEYPSYEFESIRTKFKGKNPNVADAIISFYAQRAEMVPDPLLIDAMFQMKDYSRFWDD